MKKLLLSVLISCAGFQGISQNMSAYIDYRNYFFAFDDGTYTQLDHQRPMIYKIGGNSIAYISNANNFKVFSHGINFDVTEGAFVREFSVNSTMVVYLQSNQLNVFERGNPKTLSTWVTAYAVGDSIVVYFDDISKNLKAYWDGSSYYLDDLLAGGSNIHSYRVGDNLVAYVNRNHIMQVFYHGALFDLQNTDNDDILYDAGMDVVPFVDQLNNTFNVFYRGKTYQLETTPPESMKAGCGLVAYVDIDGNFKRFSDGKTKVISTFAPENYFVKDSMIVYYDNNNNFNVFYNGKTYMLENYIPKDVKADNNIVVYIDQLNRLKIFQDGESKIICYDIINSFDVSWNVVTYNILNNETKFYYKGRVY
jgi:hypothetical protein